MKAVTATSAVVWVFVVASAAACGGETGPVVAASTNLAPSIATPQTSYVPPVAIPSQSWQQTAVDHPALENWRPALRDLPTPASEQPTGKGPRADLGDLIPLDGALGAGIAVSRMPDPEMPTRQRKRMNIDQLDAALQKASGGIGWMIGTKNQFAVLAATLGKPDFIDTTQEDLTISTLFEKFLGDAAVHICAKLVAADAKAVKADRVYFVKSDPNAIATKDAAAVSNNLAYLLLRWHGRTVAASAPEVSQWQFLLASAQKVSTPAEGWQAVCMALIAHPNFFTY